MEHERTCFFIGHREANERVLPALEQAVEQLIVESGVTDFVVGHYGAFDGMDMTALFIPRAWKMCRKSMPSSAQTAIWWITAAI